MGRVLPHIAVAVGLLALIWSAASGTTARTARRQHNLSGASSISAPVLALPGPLFASSLPNDSATASSLYPYPHHLLIHGHPLLYDPSLSASTSDPASHAINTARHAWDAGFVLSKLLERYNPVDIDEDTIHSSTLPARCDSESSDMAEAQHRSLARDLRLDSTSVVVELGAGAHMLPSLTAWRLGVGQVTATDVHEMIEWMQHTADINQHYAAHKDAQPTTGQVRVVAVDWTAQNEQLLPIDPQPTLLLASDVIWLHNLIPALVRTIASLLSHSRPPSVLYLTHQHRSAVGWRRFEVEAEQRALSVLAMHRCLQAEGYSSDKVDVYRITQKAQ